MNGTELFEITLLLWGGVAGVFVLAGFITGEWVDAYRSLRDWLRERSDHDGASPHPRAT